MKDTQVMFPLTKNALLLGELEGKDVTEEAVESLVAGANAKTIGHAFEQVYAAKRSFPYIGPGMTYRFDSNFMEVWAAERERLKRQPV